MLSANPSSSRITTALFTLMMIAAFGVSVGAQEAPAVHVGYTRITGLPDDWTHHRVVFSNPGTEQQAIKHGTHEHWLKVVNDPRYVIQQLKHNLPVQGPAADDVKMRYREAAENFEIRRKLDGDPREGHRHNSPTPSAGGSTVTRDWSQGLGAGATVGAGNYPAKYSFNGPALCSDFVVFNTSLAGVASGQATIVALNNLYKSTCTGTNPGFLWAYNTGTGATVTSSPVISYDGTQVAFVQTASSKASLVILRGVSGEGSSATASATPATVSTCTGPVTTSGACNTQATAYKTCKGGLTSCELILPFDGATTPNNTTSDPYYDYANDVIYVGDASGNVHKFTGVFNGTPSEVVSTGTNVWPAAVTTRALTSPVYDAGASGLIFVGAVRSGGVGGVFASVDPTIGSGAGGLSSRATQTSSTALDAPIVDSSAEKVYFFVGNDGGFGCGTFQACLAVYQYNAAAAISGQNKPNETTVGFASGSTTNVLYAGAFDDAYFSSPTPSTPTGNLYVCGFDTAGNTEPTLYQIEIAAGVVNTTAVTGPTITNASASCSPVTEIDNGQSGANERDWIFLSVTGSGNLTVSPTCTNACVYSFNVIATTTGGTTSGSKTVTSTASFFNTADVGATISGGGIPAGSTITARASSTSVTISANATSTNSGEPITITRVPSAATDGLAAASGSSGIIVDGNLTTTGASQIYFTPLTGNTGAVQASQAALQ